MSNETGEIKEIKERILMSKQIDRDFERATGIPSADYRQDFLQRLSFRSESMARWSLVISTGALILSVIALFAQ